jgi:hypothetical protein
MNDINAILLAVIIVMAHVGSIWLNIKIKKAINKRAG